MDVWGNRLQFGPALMTRIILGLGFYYTGKGKLNNLERVSNWFSSLGIPFPEAHAWFIGHLEYFGGILLLVGLGTRLISMLLGSTMVVALLTADKAQFLGSFTPKGDLPIEVTAFAYLAFLSWLILTGPGFLSLDTVISKQFGLRPKAETATS